MSDGLSKLRPSDPRNLLCVDARKRIQRIHIESETFIWQTEVSMQNGTLSGIAKKRIRCEERRDLNRQNVCSLPFGKSSAR